MYKFSFLLKTYAKDFQLTERLIFSFNQYNIENLPLFLIVPRSDLSNFNFFESANISLIAEESLSLPLTLKNVSGIRSGYINQQIIKIGFWESDLTENYMCLDADGEFIRNFYLTDFMANENIPYTVLVEDLDLQSDSKYYEEHWVNRDKALKKIISYLGLKPGRNYKTCHHFTIFNSKVLKSLKTEILEANNLTYADLLEIAPYEFSWYNFYLQSKSFEIYPTEPYFKTIHNNSQLLQSQIIGTKKMDFARSYVGIVVNSNFRSSLDQISINENPNLLLSRELNFIDIYRIIHYKILFTIIKKKNIAKHYIKGIIFLKKNL